MVLIVPPPQLRETLHPSDLSMPTEGYKSILGCPEDLFKQFIQYYALVYKGWWCIEYKTPCSLYFFCLHTTPHHRNTQLHEQTHGCVQWIIVSRVLVEESPCIYAPVRILTTVSVADSWVATSHSWMLQTIAANIILVWHDLRSYLSCFRKIWLSFSGETCCAICRNVMSVYSLSSHINDTGLDGYMDPWRDVLVDSISREKRDVRQVTVEYVTFRKCKQLQ